MDLHWWYTITGFVVLLLTAGAMWGSLTRKVEGVIENVKKLENKLQTCKDNGYVDSAHCDKCKAEFHDDIRDIEQDLKACKDDFHKFQLSMNGKVGKIDGIVSRFGMEGRS